MTEEKLKKARDAEKLNEEDRKRIIAEKNEKMNAIITDIKKELVRLEDILPMKIEKPDNIPISPNGDFFLFKKLNEKKLKVIRYDAKRGAIEQTTDDFMAYLYSWGNEEALLQMKGRIPGFIEYLSTQV
jgi:hypothetical protein